MSEMAPDSFEATLRRALAPVEPPAELAQRLEDTLQELTLMAADELEAWELGAMRDPRNWMRPVIAAGVGATAGTALVLLRVRAVHRRRRSRDPLDVAGRALGGMTGHARRLRRR